MKAYSQDLRDRVISKYKSGKYRIKELAIMFNSPYAKTLFVRKFTSSFIDAIFAATNNLYLMAK